MSDVLCLTFATLLPWPAVSAASNELISITQCINYAFIKFEGLKLINSFSCSGAERRANPKAPLQGHPP